MLNERTLDVIASMEAVIDGGCGQTPMSWRSRPNTMRQVWPTHSSVAVR